MTRDQFVESLYKIEAEFSGLHDAGKICYGYRDLYPVQEEFEEAVRAQIKHELRLMNKLMSKRG